MKLLLLADEQENMIEKYLDCGEMFILEENGKVCAECVLTDAGNSACEIKNIAVLPEAQRKGYGRALIDYVENYCKGRFSVLCVGTGDCPLTIPFYESCGFKRSYIIKNFFTDNYDHTIIEDGVILRDMIYLEKTI